MRFICSIWGSKILYATLKGKNSEAKSDEPQYGAIFKRALILSLTNPKAILFYVSFFVQFIDVNAPHTGISFFILAATLETGEFLLFELPDYIWCFCHAVHTYQKETG
ncbi:putative transport protein [Escherichia coli]|nr:putative transport protein [Escherichia coli]